MKSQIDIKKIRISLVLVLLIGLVGFTYLLLIRFTGIIIPCFFFELTGHYCPGCGITRLFLSLFQLRFYQAFRYNPLVFCMLPFGFYMILIEFKSWLYGSKTKSVPEFIWNILLVITIGFGILRNLEPFSFLGPTLIN